MPFKYNIYVKAQVEYEEAVSWYLDRSLDAATKFVDAIDHAIQMICERPDRWNNKFKNFYEFNIRKFPFTVVYVFDDESKIVTVFSIFHHKRNPRKKYKR